MSSSKRDGSVPGSPDPDFLLLLAEALRDEHGQTDAHANTNGSETAYEDKILHALEELGDANDARLLEDGTLRALVVDVSLAESVAAENDDVPFSSDVREAALAAFSVQSQDAVIPIETAGGVRTEPLRAAAFRPMPFVRTWMAAAAMVLVALGAVVFLSATDDAEAGLQLNSLKRVDLAGSVRLSSTEPRYFAKLGHVFTPGEDELLSFGFGPEALVVVGAGDAVRVTRVSDSFENLLESLDTDTDAVLRLESGEARLATSEGPVLLELGSAGILVLLEGAAHAAYEAAGSAPAVALAEGSVARFHRAKGAPVPLTGPSRVLLRPEGPQAFGKPARTLFRHLEFFGGPLPRETQVRTVSPRLWKIEAGAKRSRSDIRVEAGKAARLTWRVPVVLADATTLRVALRAPKGTTVEAVGLGKAAVNGSSSSTEPGVATVEIALPARWYERIEGRMLALVIEIPEIEIPTTAETSKATRAWFDGVSLVLGSTNEMAIDHLAGRPDWAAAEARSDG